MGPPRQSLNFHIAYSVYKFTQAAHCMANSAYSTRESGSNGQIIIFSGEPKFSGATLETNRLPLNAVVFDLGMRTPPNIEL
jgi:hypothetical protein